MALFTSGLLIQLPPLPLQGPCRTAMISILKRLKVSDTLNPRRLSIPNCDKKGFYKKKQVRI